MTGREKLEMLESNPNRLMFLACDNPDAARTLAEWLVRGIIVLTVSLPDGRKINYGCGSYREVQDKLTEHLCK